MASIPIFNIVDKEGNPCHEQGKDSLIFLASKLNSGDETRLYCLSPAEFQLLEISCRLPLANNELAALLNISGRTIRNHFNSIFRKFDISPGELHAKRTVLISKLVKEGVLEYRPRIKEEDWNLMRALKVEL